jgi:ABC-type transport system substrate-binding protein
MRDRNLSHVSRAVIALVAQYADAVDGDLDFRLARFQGVQTDGGIKGRPGKHDLQRPVQLAVLGAMTEPELDDWLADAATRIEAHLIKGGVFSYGSYPDIEELYRQQATELDRKKRETLLHKIQQIMTERVIYAPIWQLAFINGVGARVGESGFAKIALFPYTSPYEDITLKS